MKKLFCLLLALICAAIIGILVFFLAYMIAETISPPITSDGHTVMPIGQVFIGAIAGFAFGIASLLLLFRIFKRRFT
jgi:uncharacterized membrane protein YraQ (UPF0718 family)